MVGAQEGELEVAIAHVRSRPALGGRTLVSIDIDVGSAEAGAAGHVEPQARSVLWCDLIDGRAVDIPAGTVGAQDIGFGSGDRVDATLFGGAIDAVVGFGGSVVRLVEQLIDTDHVNERELLHVLNEILHRSGHAAFGLGLGFSGQGIRAIAAIDFCNPGWRVPRIEIALELRGDVRMAANQSHVAVPVVNHDFPIRRAEIRDQAIDEAVMQPAGASDQARDRGVDRADAVAEPLYDIFAAEKDRRIVIGRAGTAGPGIDAEIVEFIGDFDAGKGEWAVRGIGVRPIDGGGFRHAIELGIRIATGIGLNIGVGESRAEDRDEVNVGVGGVALDEVEQGRRIRATVVSAADRVDEVELLGSGDVDIDGPRAGGSVSVYAPRRPHGLGRWRGAGWRRAAKSARGGEEEGGHMKAGGSLGRSRRGSLKTKIGNGGATRKRRVRVVRAYPDRVGNFDEAVQNFQTKTMGGCVLAGENPPPTPIS